MVLWKPERALDPLELELKAVVTHLVRVLVTELRLLKEQYVFHWAILQL